MKNYNITSVANGVSVLTAPANRFKTNEISIGIAVPLDEKTASVNAVLISMLARSTKKYPNMLALNRKLDMLYGASVSASIVKSGENQVLGLSISSLDDRFSLEDSKISSQSLELLFSMLFDANVDDNGNFYQEDIEREKRIIVEKIESEHNEKRVYSLRRLEEIMFENEAFAVNRYGSVDSVNAVTNEDLKKALCYFISGAKIMITAVGNANEENIVKLTKNVFADVERDYHQPKQAVIIPKAESVKDVTERIEVKQGKLLLGFRVDVMPDSDNTKSARAFADIFGGGPYSKLFANVREKLSLCYYCSARYDKRKSVIIVQCGCEEENMDKAISEILNQLEIIRNGDFDKEYQASRMGLCDSINAVKDDSIYLLSWYNGQIVDDEIVSPEESSAKHLSVEKNDIVEMAKAVSLDTVFRLCSVKEGE